jgi:hypothetical protein
MCGRYYAAKAKLCVLERQKIGDELEMLVFERDCPNCGYLNREPDPDIKRRVIQLKLETNSRLGGEIDDHRKIRQSTASE